MFGRRVGCGRCRVATKAPRHEAQERGIPFTAQRPFTNPSPQAIADARVGSVADPLQRGQRRQCGICSLVTPAQCSSNLGDAARSRVRPLQAGQGVGLKRIGADSGSWARRCGRARPEAGSARLAGRIGLHLKAEREPVVQSRRFSSVGSVYSSDCPHPVRRAAMSHGPLARLTSHRPASPDPADEMQDQTRLPSGEDRSRQSHFECCARPSRYSTASPSKGAWNLRCPPPSTWPAAVL